MATDQMNPAADPRSFRVLAWVGVALQAAALVFVVISQRWGGLPPIGIFLLLSLLFLVMQDHVPSLISFLVVVAAMVNAGGWAWEWFHLVWFDELVHAFSTMAVIAAVLCSAWGWGWLAHPLGIGQVLLLAAVTGLALGILWEIVEATCLAHDDGHDVRCGLGCGRRGRGRIASWLGGRGAPVATGPKGEGPHASRVAAAGNGIAAGSLTKNWNDLQALTFWPV